MNATIFRLFLLCVLLWPLSGLALELHDGEKYRVRYVIDGDTMILDNDAHIRLVSINAPEIAHENSPAQPFGDEAKDFLTNWLTGREVTLRINKTTSHDRYNRWLAQIYDANGTWAQEVLVRQGYAHVYSFADSRDSVGELEKVESAAMLEKRGMWGSTYHSVLKADDVDKIDNRFHVIEGVVRQVAKVKGDVYLNFGDDWKTDFTAFIPKKYLESVTAALGDPKQLKGRKLRVRGWVFSRNGPMIEITHPEIIQFLE